MTAPRLQVLLVDDEEPLLFSTAAALSEDFDVRTAPNADAALELLARHRFDVLCTDFYMPGRDGMQLLRETAERYPHVAGVLVTGYREYLDRREPQDDAQGLFYLVLKPCPPPDLIAMIRRAAEASRLKREMSLLTSGLAARRGRPR